MTDRHRRRHKGVLTAIRDGGRGHKKKATPLRRVLNWLGGGLIVAGMVVMVVLLGLRFFNPVVASRNLEATARIEEILGDGTSAQVSVEGQRISIPLTAEERAKVEVGDAVRVRYSINMQFGSVELHDWEPVPAE